MERIELDRESAVLEPEIRSRGFSGSSEHRTESAMSNLLLVDDDGDLIETLAEVLRRVGHDVRTASDGVQGLHALHDAPLPDVVVLDVDMPVLNGPGMAHEMLLHDAGQEHIPVMLVSGSPDLAQIAGRMGTPYFLTKGANLKEFLDVLGRAVRERLAPSSA